MDSAEFMLQPLLPPAVVENLSARILRERIAGPYDAEADRISEDRKQQIAKDFESLVLGKLLDEMKNTIGGWGSDEDGASEQVHGLFWLYLARHLANVGGLGLCNNIYDSLTRQTEQNVPTESVDSSI
jgi:Rod binding domain-containing protein